MRGVIGYGILCILPILVHASEIQIDTWNTENGLPDSSVTSIAQTPDGYLWVGTYNGLARFDGVRFVTFTPETTPELKHFRVQHLFMDVTGMLWINTYDGSLTSWRNGTFKLESIGNPQRRYEAAAVSTGPDHLTFSFQLGGIIRRPLGPKTPVEWQVFRQPRSVISSTDTCGEDEQGVIWLRSMPDQQVWRITNGRFERMTEGHGLTGHRIESLTADPAKRIWVTTEREIAVWNGKEFESTVPTGIEGNLDGALLFFSRDGGMWMAANGQLRKWSGGQWSSVLAFPQNVASTGFCEAMHEDRHGGLWFLLRDAGLFYIATDGSQHRITIADGLPSERITSWFEDREGDIWLGIGQGGLACVRKKRFQVIGVAEGLPAQVAVSVCEDSTGAMWIGTFGAGLTRWKDGLATQVPMTESGKGGFVDSVYPSSSEQLWVSAGREDLFLVKDGRMQTAPCQVHGIKALLVDHRGRLWMGQFAGLSRWSEGTLKVWSADNGFVGNRISALAEDSQGAIWAGAHDGSIYKFTDDTFQRFEAPDFPVQQSVWSLLADHDGSLWIGTSGGGILRLKDGRFTRFTTENGLPDNVICQMLDDQQGNLWIGSHHGIFRVAKNSLNAFASGSSKIVPCVAYGLQDGLPTLECSGSYQPAAWRSHDGRLWFTTAKGVVSMQPREMTALPLPPLVKIEELAVNGTIQKPDSSLQEKTAQEVNPVFSIAPGKQNFEFRYTGLSFAEPDNIRFRYKLEGLQPDWVEAGTRRYAQYSFLPPGDYRFHVTACSNDGIWSQADTVWTIKVSPYFWQTWWFLGLTGLTLTGGVAETVHIASTRRLRQKMQRLERQRALEHDRTRIARDIHDHIGSGLTRINLLNELLLGDPVEHQADRVNQITGVSCELMRAMDEIVWAVNPKNDTLDSLVSYLCDFADEYLRAAKIRLRISLPPVLPTWQLTSEVRHNLYLAVKEILNNIVKHSQASEVLFSLRLEGGMAKLEIRDNGRGFQLDCISRNLPNGRHSSCGNGLENLQKRAATINGHCLIGSEPGNGTRIELAIPEAKKPEKDS